MTLFSSSLFVSLSLSPSLPLTLCLLSPCLFSLLRKYFLFYFSLTVSLSYPFLHGNLPVPISLSLSENSDRLQRTTRAMFVREPLSRLWAVYLDKFVLPDSWLDHGLRILHRRRWQALHRGVCFVLIFRLSLQ